MSDYKLANQLRCETESCIFYANYFANFVNFIGEYFLF